MKMLPVRDDLCIRIDKIDKLEKVDENVTRVYCALDIYDVTLPYSIMVDICNQDDYKPENEALLREISLKIGNLPVFAG